MFKMEDDSSNEPCTSTGEEVNSTFQEADNSKSVFEADSRGHMPCVQVHPKDKAVLDLIDKFHTRRSTQWALYSWNTWRNDKMEENSDQAIIPCFYDLCEQTNEVMDENLSLFVTECKNKEGEDYAKETLRGIVFGLQRFLKTYCTSRNISPRTFVKNEFHFPKYNEALKNRLQVLDEVVAKRNVQAVGITLKEEEHLWDIGIFGCSSAEALCNTVFFYTVKIFGIVSSTALRAMKPDTVVFGENELGKYIEVDTEFASELDIFSNSSCCHNLALLAPHTTTKLRHFYNENNPRTFYNIVKYYLELIKQVDGGENCLFLRPKKGMVFSTQAIGRNQLQKKISKIMTSAGLHGYFTTQALVQSCIDNLQVKGYMVRRKQSFMPQHKIEISKLLDPPPGIVDTYEVKSQTKAILQLVSQSQTLPNQQDSNQGKVQYIYQVGQYPQFESIFKAQQNSQNIVGGKTAEIMDLKPTLQPSGSVLNVGLQPKSTVPFAKSVSDLTYPVIESNKNVTKTAVIIPASTSTGTVKDTSVIQNSTENNVYPVLLQIAGTTNTGRGESHENKPDTVHEQKFENVIIKQEPVNSEDESYKSPTSSTTTQKDESRKRKYDNNEPSVEATKMVKLHDRNREKIIIKTDLNEDENVAEKEYISEESKSEIKEEIVDRRTCEAEIEYSFSNDLNKKITKQEMSLKEEGETMFSFSGTSKMGKSIGDLEFNLGDYLPENCTIKPGDINIKRMILSDGGKMVIKLKYTNAK